MVSDGTTKRYKIVEIYVLFFDKCKSYAIFVLTQLLIIWVLIRNLILEHLFASSSLSKNVKYEMIWIIITFTSNT